MNNYNKNISNKLLKVKVHKNKNINTRKCINYNKEKYKI